MRRSFQIDATRHRMMMSRIAIHTDTTRLRSSLPASQYLVDHDKDRRHDADDHQGHEQRKPHSRSSASFDSGAPLWQSTIALQIRSISTTLPRRAVAELLLDAHAGRARTICPVAACTDALSTTRWSAS